MEWQAPMIGDMGPGLCSVSPPGQQQVNIGNNQTLPHTAKHSWLSNITKVFPLFMQNRRGFHEVDETHPDFELIGWYILFFVSVCLTLTLSIYLFQNVSATASSIARNIPLFSQSFT